MISAGRSVLDTAEGSLSGLSYGDGMEELAKPGDWDDPYLYGGGLCGDRDRALDAVLAGGCGDTRVGHDTEELSPLWQAIDRDEGEGGIQDEEADEYRA